MFVALALFVILFSGIVLMQEARSGGDGENGEDYIAGEISLSGQEE